MSSELSSYLDQRLKAFQSAPKPTFLYAAEFSKIYRSSLNEITWKSWLLELVLRGGYDVEIENSARRSCLEHTGILYSPGTHCCGKERAAVEMCAVETDLDCINPLEIPPQGDCDLAEIENKFGHRISLMENLHTTNTMLFGAPEDVEEAARQAIDDAGNGGGFVLSTGDQCGRNTPDENILAMIKVARSYGVYS